MKSFSRIIPQFRSLFFSSGGEVIVAIKDCYLSCILNIACYFGQDLESLVAKITGVSGIF